ncbi:MAG: hypothetical protein F4227_03970 [Gammaproteobacteria bacterium]|nr:hypothetical protein [Gammaproteobacteria bacterium]MYF02138.1 hypothetical protein [Gammaproteobacteria bacterium]
MSPSLPSTNSYQPLLTPNVSAWFYATRFMILFLSVVGGVCTLFNSYGVLVGYGFGFVCPMIANAVWQSRLSKQNTPRSDSSPLKYRNYLILKPQFFLPILHHIALGIERIYKIPPEENEESALILGEASSFEGSTNKTHAWCGRLQNHIVVALVTSCCQVYGIVVYFMHLIKPLG